MAHKKEKLSDKVARGDFVFRRPARAGETPRTFADIYPQLASLDITVREVDGSRASRVVDHLSVSSTPGQVIDCRNPSCKGGGLFLDSDIDKAIRQALPTIDVSVKCRGVTRQRPRLVSCEHTFKIAGTMSYKAATH